MINNISSGQMETPAIRNGIKIDKETVQEEPVQSRDDSVHLNSTPKRPGIIGRFVNSSKDFINRVGDKTADFISKNITGDNREVESGSLYKSVRKCSDYCNNHARYAAIGASSGGAIGTAIGLFKGYDAVMNDKIELKQKTVLIQDPKLEGFSHWSHETGYYTQEYRGTDSEGRAQYDDVWHSTGYDHSFSPKISYKTVGSYEVPQYEHSNGGNPILSGFLGLVGGTAIGALAGLTVSLIQKTIRNYKG